MSRIAIGAVAGTLIFSAAFHATPGKAATETVVYSFCSQIHIRACRDGEAPSGGLINVRGTLYGTTTNGGTCDNGNGTVFSLDPQTGALTTLHSFCKPHTTRDGSRPASALTYWNGKLYGTTPGGGYYPHVEGFGQRGAGTVFSIDLETGSETVLYRFRDGSDGAFPNASLIKLSGTLYGTTSWGGIETGGGCYPQGCGTIFSLDPNTGAETGLYSFCSQQNCTDGAFPGARLIHVNGMLYGTTESGGISYYYGTVVSLDPSNGAEKVLYSFCSQQNCTDGEGPNGLINVNGTFFGTTFSGGTGTSTGCSGFGCGTVFSLDPSTGVETVLYSFCSQQKCTDGAAPQARLIEVNGILYGTTVSGGTSTGCGSYGCGTVFSVDSSTGAEATLYSFCSQQNCTDGAVPRAELIEVNGTFYGTTSGGGAHNGGTVFAITL